MARVTWRSSERKTTAWQEIAGGYRSALEEASRTDGIAEWFIQKALTAGFGTTELDEVERLFTTRTSVRTFRVAEPK